MAPDGDRAMRAVVDQIGTIIEAGRSVIHAVRDTTIWAFRNFMFGNARLRVLSKPPMIGTTCGTAAPPTIIDPMPVTAVRRGIGL